MCSRFVVLGLLLSLGLTSPVYASKRIAFSPSSAEIANPERGFWKFAANDFSDVKPDDLKAIGNEGISVVYGLVRLDEFRDKPISNEKIDRINAAFEAVRTAGLKVILRFAYNYPSSSSDYANAKDANWSVMRGHITQLAPVINRNKDVLAAFQAGFIGAWGEQHTSSNNLDTPEAKRNLRDALYAAFDSSITVQWRYPQDISSWLSTMTAEQKQRTAFHNDCFLSSPTDVGTYSEDTSKRNVEREDMKKLTAYTYFSGEVCDAQKDQIRSDCKSILKEGAEFHLSSLNLDYYTAFHRKWKKQGCYKEVSRKMGYRFVLKTATYSDQDLTIEITNEGWAKLTKPRVLRATADGQNISERTGLDLSGIEPGKTRQLRFNFQKITVPVRVCLSAPDPEPSLANDQRYAITFANRLLYGQTYGPEKTGFCFLAD